MIYMVEHHGADATPENGTAPDARRNQPRYAHHTKRSTYAPTDLGNAEFFAEEYGDEVRYVYEWRSWVHWDGKRWKIDKSGQAALSRSSPATKPQDGVSSVLNGVNSLN